MDDEIDLQKYFLLLINNWKWIAGVTFILVLAALLLSLFVLPPTYEAKALVVIVPTRYSLTFDPRFQTDTTPDLLFYRPAAQLAESDAMMQALYDGWINQTGDSELTIEALKGVTTVEYDTVSNSLELFVTSDDPKMAADLVNLWANFLVQRANELFGETLEGGETLEAQFAQIEAGWETAQQALVEFEGQNQLTTFRAEKLVKETVYAQFVTDQAKFNQVLQDLETLQAQLSGLPASQEVSFDTELTALLLQLKAYNLDATLTQVQIVAQPSGTPRSVRELTTHLDQLHTVLAQKTEAITLQLAPLRTEILLLQSQIKSLETTGERLQQNYQVASDTYLTLARKLEETQISNEVSGGIVKLASGANIPTEPVGPRTLINLLVAGATGLILSIVGIFFNDFWANLPQDQRPFRPKPAKA